MLVRTDSTALVHSIVIQSKASSTDLLSAELLKNVINLVAHKLYQVLPYSEERDLLGKNWNSTAKDTPVLVQTSAAL